MVGSAATQSLLTMRYKTLCLFCGLWTVNMDVWMRVNTLVLCGNVCVCVYVAMHIYISFSVVCTNTNDSKFESILICYSMYAVTAAATVAMDRCIQNAKCGANILTWEKERTNKWALRGESEKSNKLAAKADKSWFSHRTRAEVNSCVVKKWGWETCYASNTK